MIFARFFVQSAASSMSFEAAYTSILLRLLAEMSMWRSMLDAALMWPESARWWPRPDLFEHTSFCETVESEMFHRSPRCGA